MVPTAVSQVLEAMTKLIVGLFLAWYLLRLGFGSEFSAAGAHCRRHRPAAWSPWST